MLAMVDEHIVKHRLGVNSWGSEDHLELMTWQDDHGPTIWEGVSINARQAVDLAKLIEAPPERMWVDYSYPAKSGPRGEYRNPWLVSRVLHSNGVFDSHIGLRANGQKSIDLGIDEGKVVSGLQEYWHCNPVVTLNTKQRARLAAILYYWGGAGLIGYKTVTKTKSKRVLDICT